MTPNILDPSALISSLPLLLSPQSKRLESPTDGIAALVHTALSALGFRLVSANEESIASSSNVLPAVWNKNGPGHYSFKYRHEQSSLEFQVQISKLGSRTVINAIALESDKVATLDISTDDFSSPSFFPHVITGADDKPLIHGFISSNRVTDLMDQFRLKVVQKLLPGLQKPGYTEESETSEPTVASSSTPQTQQPPPQRPRVPPDTPESDHYVPPRLPPGRNPLEIGRSDLDPFPQNPFAPPSLFPPGSGDGMFVGPEHPIFGGGVGGIPRRGPWGGDGYLPPLGAPPGARFDPVGPMFPNRPPRRPGFPPGASNTQDPGNDEFMPPGMGDMYM